MAAARRRVEELELVLPVIERAEAEALAATRAQLDQERRRRLERELRALVTEAMRFTAHYANAAS